MNSAQMLRLTTLPAILFFALIFASPAHADFTVSASDSAIIQPGGPRSGANGKRLFNIEGANNGVFASFGVLDFLTPVGTTISMAQTLQLDLTEVDATFTRPGALNFYLTSDTMTGIQPGTSPLTFQSSNLPDGLGTQLTPNYLLGSQTFNTTGNANSGQVDIYSFTLSGAAQTYLTNQINAGGDIRLIVTPGDATVEATYAGSTNMSFSSPALTVTTPLAVPEPSSFVTLLVAMPLIAAGLRTRRKG